MTKPREFEPNYSSTLGLKQSHAETNMPFGALLDVLNMNLDGIGGKSPRNGYQELFHLTNGIGGARVHETIKSLIQFKPTTGGTKQILAFADDSIYKKNPSGTDTSVLASGLTAGARWDFVQYNDYIHGVNGNDPSFLYDGTNIVTISITAPTAHVTLTDSGVGTLPAGDYSYLVTFYDSARARESAPYSVSTAPSVTVAINRKITLSNLPSETSGEGVTHYRIYRRGPAETVYTMTAEIVIASATYDDTGDATGTTELVIDTGAIDTGYTAHPQSELIEECFDRVFMVPTSNPTNFVYSLPGGQSFAFPTGNNKPLGRNDGYPIVGMHRHGDSIVFHKRNSWWILDGDPAVTTPRRISGVGTQDINASASDDNNILRLTPKGLYLSTPTDFDPNDLRESYIGKDVVTEENLIDWSNSSNISVVSYDGGISSHMYVISPNSSDFTSKFLVLDTVLKEWVKYELGTDVTAVTHYEEDEEALLMMGDGYGMVWTWDVGYADGHSMTNALSNGTFTAVTNTTFSDTSKLTDSGTATAGGAATLTDSTKNFEVNAHVGKQIYISSGTGSGQYDTILSNTATVITITGTWTTQPDATSTYEIGGWPVNGLIGVLVSTRIGTGSGQKRRIESNTPTSCTITTAWGTNPDTETEYSIGAIDKYGEEFWNNNGDSHTWKRMRWILPFVRQQGDYPITISLIRDFRRSPDISTGGTFNVFSSNSLWDVLIWDTDNWGTTDSVVRRFRLNGKYRYYAIKYQNDLAVQPFNWDGHGAVFQRLYDRNG